MEKSNSRLRNFSSIFRFLVGLNVLIRCMSVTTLASEPDFLLEQRSTSNITCFFQQIPAVFMALKLQRIGFEMGDDYFKTATGLIIIKKVIIQNRHYYGKISVTPLRQRNLIS